MFMFVIIASPLLLTLHHIHLCSTPWQALQVLDVWYMQHRASPGQCETYGMVIQVTIMM